jgi:hypothetical protein
MPENPILPSPNQVLGSKNNNLPSPNEVFNPKLRQGDTSIIQPTYTKPIDRQIDSTLDFIQENSLRNMRDDEKDILRNMMKNPLTSKEELSDAIVTLQGKKAKQQENTILQPDYYLKKDEVSGNYKPIALTQYEKVPRGYDTPSIWGTKESAKDDNAWQDIGKSVANGAISLVQGVVETANSLYGLTTGKESEWLTGSSQGLEYAKFKKDEDLNRPIYNTEGIEKFSDLFDKGRVDLGPQALWGAFNGLVESGIEIGLGALTGATEIRAAKALKYGYQGIDKAITLGNKSKFASVMAGSFFSYIKEARDVADEAGLEGRDKEGFALGISMVKSSIDAATGLEGKIMDPLFKKAEKEVFNKIISKVEKDAVTGLVSKESLKKIMNEASVGYAELAKGGLKHVVKDMFQEGGNEVATDFAQKAGEQLWDKMTDEERGRFGTDALSAKSFGQYVNSFATGWVSGAPMSAVGAIIKNKHEEQSINAYERVKQGPEAVAALKTDLQNALQKGDITDSEHEQAIFKIDAYQKYHEETKGVNLQPQDEKKAFELSFQIQGLKTEIPTNENEIPKLDPIPRSKVEGKQSQVKKLQKELTEIIERGQIKGEPVVPKKEEEKIAKEKEKEVATKSEEFQRRKKEAEAKLTQKEALEPNPNFPIEPIVEKKPERAYITDKRTYEDVPAEEWNHSTTDERLLHRLSREHIWEQPNHEVNGQLYLHQYEYKGKKNRTIGVKLEDGKILKLASTKVKEGDVDLLGGLSGYFHTERLKGNITNEPVGIKVVELAPEEINGKIVKKRVIKIYQKSSGKYLAYIKETHKGQKDAKDKYGNPLYSYEQIKGELEDIKLQDEKPLPPDEVDRLRNTPIVPIMPKSPTERGKEALSGVVGESKAQVEAEKASIPLTITNAVRQQLYDLGFSKANVDAMKPERALDIINKQEVKPKEANKPAEEGTTKDKFKKSVELYYEATESEGASKRRSKANERKKFLEENPSIKYIDDNMQSIYKQLEAKNLLTKKGNCP